MDVRIHNITLINTAANTQLSVTVLEVMQANTCTNLLQ